MSQICGCIGSSSRSSYLEAPTPLDRGDISGDLTDFSSINGPLRAVKGTEERDESHVNPTRHCGKSPATMNKVLHRVYLSSGSTHAAGSR